MLKRRLTALILVLCLFLSSMVLAGDAPLSDGNWEGGCTDILVSKGATADGSVIGTYSCDGAAYAHLEVVPAKTYKKTATLPILYRPYPNNYKTAQDNLALEEVLGEIPQVAETYRYIVNSVYYDDQNCGGVNEHGLAIGETTIGGVRDLRVPVKVGWMWAYSNYPSTSLMALGLQRAKTAREAVQIMGALAEKYGYVQSGEHMTISDKNEVWAMEIFGGGKDWTPESGKPGAVWAAVRVPEGHMALSANSSRIGLIETIETDGTEAMYSSNTYSLAKEMGRWTEGTPFVWYQVYGNRTPAHSMREWSVVNKLAPSLGVKPEDPIFFSFAPDAPVTLETVMAMYRDYLTGTEYDVTQNAAYKLADGTISPLAAPFGPTELHKLLKITPQRTVATRSSVFTQIMQHKDWLPDPVGTVMWYTPGTALTGSFLPIYAGTTELPKAWTATPQTAVDRNSAWWAYTMVEGLSLLEYQNATKDIQAVRDPAEARLKAEQPAVEAKVTALYAKATLKSGKANAQKLERAKWETEHYLTDYTNENMNAAAATYWDLVDYLMFKYCFRLGKSVPTTLPAVPAAAQ